MGAQLFSTLAKKFDYRQSDAGLQVALSDEQICELAQLPEPRLHRSLSRSALLLLTLYQDLNSYLAKSNWDRTRIGVYGSLAKGAPAIALVERSKGLQDEQLTQLLLAKLPPKQLFKEGLNIAGAQLSVSLGLRGPLNTFPHWQYGIQHCLESIEMDFENDMIDAAIVFGTFALDNPFTNLFLNGKIESSCIFQEAASAAIVPDIASVQSMREQLTNLEWAKDERCFAYAEPLIRLQQMGFGEYR